VNALPWAIVQSLIVRYAGLTAWTRVDQVWSVDDLRVARYDRAYAAQPLDVLFNRDSIRWLERDAAAGAGGRTLRAERRYERLAITGLTGVTSAQRAALLALGAIEEHGPTSASPEGLGVLPTQAIHRIQGTCAGVQVIAVDPVYTS
jgi:hypothetical protein